MQLPWTAKSAKVEILTNNRLSDYYIVLAMDLSVPNDVEGRGKKRHLRMIRVVCDSIRS